VVEARRAAHAALGVRRRRRSQAGLIRTLVPVGLALAGAVVYATNPTISFLLYVGVISFMVNVALAALFVIRDKSRGATSRYSFDSMVLTMIIPYATMYLFFAFTLTRFRLPIEG
jgi:uncharacterized membrane protein